MANDDWEAFVSMWEDLDHEFLDKAGDDFAGQAQELFTMGFIEVGPDMQVFRDEFFALMEEYDISIDLFDWDAWRDWYEAS